MPDLFAQEPSAPLAEALRPKTLDEVIGQSHLLGEGKPLIAGLAVVIDETADQHGRTSGQRHR